MATATSGPKINKVEKMKTSLIVRDRDWVSSSDEGIVIGKKLAIRVKNANTAQSPMLGRDL
jgi:hypothetical protein